ncbi:Hypothetical predicted protein [Drosophila guanche]|uniref:Uncharacterized protein n=1 Tax=Drosophila guanche TaxID=7266 RepID=A0A3B0J6C2_DROGU|nr:Hypothetical predicted protein [Drosophila guanche]
MGMRMRMHGAPVTGTQQDDIFIELQQQSEYELQPESSSFSLHPCSSRSRSSNLSPSSSLNRISSLHPSPMNKRDKVRVTVKVTIAVTGIDIEAMSAAKTSC